MTKTKIPKTIHYCWFGGKPLPDLAQKCIVSWKKFCPDYEIKEWNESNFNLDVYPYAREAYDHKKFAFVTDVVRLYVLYHYGGIYMDTDVELLKNIDDFLQHEGFSGFESTTKIPTGLMASTQHNALIKEWLEEYNGLHFIKDDGTLDLTTNVIRITNICLKHGFIPNGELQSVDGFEFFPTEYFCPKDLATGEINLTENTYSIHHFDASWLDEGVALIKKSRLDSWGFELLPQEEFIYANMLQYKFFIKNQQELFTAVNLMDRIFIAGNQHYEHDNLRILVKLFMKKIAETGINNKVTSLKLYFTAFRKWRVFETPRANFRYVYHCFRNFLNV